MALRAEHATMRRSGSAPDRSSHCWLRPALVPQLNSLFGEHTFFLDSNGLNIVEPAEAAGSGAQLAKVLNVANWSDANSANSSVPRSALERSSDTLLTFALRAVERVVSDQSQTNRETINRLWDILDDPHLNKALGLPQNSRMTFRRSRF
jgi:hypothetical protein